ncbi:hypothetical protein KUTeg_001621 [Tegillarca granosa]|uniref:Uncharacterized protein n=1 Tax=Tegillarca granosa TaxID=220873 RepID=A0ABQ9FRZ3_TEGGR|nr:hypothetical protein KUTeg_001621 [Tegillarca granosa]
MFMVSIAACTHLNKYQLYLFSLLFLSVTNMASDRRIREADLLRFKENANLREKAPVSYPRNEWFYLADNALEDAELEEKKPYAFLLPEYMVHESHKPDGDDANYERPRRAPFAFDNKSAYEREGDSIKDKTLKLPEVVKSGYGVRTGKPVKTKQQPLPEQQKQSRAAKTSQLEQEKPRLKYLPLPSEEKKPPKMSKLLSNEYDREWHEDITKWQMKQDMLRDKFKAMATDPNKQEPISSEYRSTYGKKTQKPYKNEKERKVWETKPKIDTYVDTSQKAVQGNNDLFKMSK